MTLEKGLISPQRDDTDKESSPDDISGGGRYEIKIGGHLDERWSEWLGGLAVIQDDEGNTRLRGMIPDQSALHGILGQIRDLGLRLIALRPEDD